MHFKHPELLYALVLLIIPILVHLFQLRRFRIEKFTNVKFLKKAVLQTRKSSRLKKWLVLFTRLFLLASIIIAFAQPYFPPTSGEIKAQETVIYLDNSYSMQAKGKKGVLLKRSVQDLLENLPQEGRVSLFTNASEFQDISLPLLREKLQLLDYSTDQEEWKTINLKAENLFSETPGIQKNFIAISDFQQRKGSDTINAIPETNNYWVQLQPENRSNIYVDTAFISARNLDQTELSVLIKATGNPQREVSVGLYNGKELFGRKTVALDEEKQVATSFSFPTGPIEKGKINIQDSGLLYDNDLLFSIEETPAVEVVVIGANNASFLEGIYKSPEFNLRIFPENNVDFNQLSQANLVILNEVQEIPFSLSSSLQKLNDEKAFLSIIPSVNANLESYNSFFQNSGLPAFREKVEQERLITEIIYAHSLYEFVFAERVENFQYPKVQVYYVPAYQETAILKYENGQAFLFEEDNIFVFTAPISRENSNFKSAPLIVPTFYNMGNLAISPAQLYTVVGHPQNISIKANPGRDEILKLASEETTFIPRQQNYQNKVEIFLEEDPKTAGHYQVLLDSTRLRTLSFNLDREESRLGYRDLEAPPGVEIQRNIPDVFQQIKSANEVNTLWKWFVIFALIFLFSEMLILKFLK